MDKPGSAQGGIRRIFEMSMIDTVRAAMVTAMKEHDKERKESLSMLLSALKNKQIDKREDLTEAEEFEVVKKEIKQTKETMELAPADREDIKEQCSKRLAVYSSSHRKKCQRTRSKKYDSGCFE